MSKKILIPLLLLIGFTAVYFLIIGSNAKKIENAKITMVFESKKWKETDRKDFPYRDQMSADLVSSEILKGLNKEEVVDLLGKASRIDKNYMFYLIVQKRLGLFPLHTKTLVLKLSEDDEVLEVLIHQ